MPSFSGSRVFPFNIFFQGEAVRLKTWMGRGDGSESIGGGEGGREIGWDRKGK